MYAVIETGGKQYRVAKGDVLEVELLDLPESEKGGTRTVTFDRVLLVGGASGTKIGAPTVDGARVEAAVLGAMRAPKVLVFKKKKRKGYRRTHGHRQNLLRVKIEAISA